MGRYKRVRFPLAYRRTDCGSQMNGALSLIKRLIVYLSFEAFRVLCYSYNISPTQLPYLTQSVSRLSALL